MSLRQGVTAQEENKLKHLISKGITWEELVAKCQKVDDSGKEQVPVLQDVDLNSIKKNIFDPLVRRLEEAKKANHKDIHSFEAALRKKKEEAAALKKKKDEE